MRKTFKVSHLYEFEKEFSPIEIKKTNVTKTLQNKNLQLEYNYT